jgi:HAD superfamily hydrolase (TIGR01549 family)
VTAVRPVRAVLFDLDDTLFDHLHGARCALTSVHQLHPAFAAAPFDEFSRAHARVLERLHARVVLGEIGIDEARLARFHALFSEAGVEPRADEVAAAATAYRLNYIAARRPVAGALPLLEALKPHVRIGIVSNNLWREQQEKLDACGFGPYVDALVVSEDAGLAKPDPGIFAIALERLGSKAAEAVMIGDSWDNDITGAAAAGVRSIWFNRTDLARPGDPPGIPELRSLEPVAQVLDAIFGSGPS